MPRGEIAPSLDGRVSPDGYLAGGYFAGTKLLFCDARVTAVLVHEARCRAAQRLFGVSREDAGLVSMIAIGMLAQKANHLFRLVRLPGRVDTFLGGSVLEEGARATAGDWSRQTPALGAPALVAFSGVIARPALRSTWHGARGAAPAARADFDHRYGHLVRRGPARPAPIL